MDHEERISPVLSIKLEPSLRGNSPTLWFTDAETAERSSVMTDVTDEKQFVNLAACKDLVKFYRPKKQFSAETDFQHEYKHTGYICLDERK